MNFIAGPDPDGDVVGTLIEAMPFVRTNSVPLSTRSVSVATPPIWKPGTL